MKVILIYIIVILAVLGLGFWLFSTSNSQQQPENLPGQTLEDQGQLHIDQGSFDHPAYNSNPPTSGWHWPQAAEWGIYKATQPDEQLIHNLEHGGVWIAYKPGSVDEQTVNLLQDFAKRYRKVIVEPREANDAAIALAAWTHLDKLDQYDESQILRFIASYYDRGPEKVN
ncbi:MAG: hypothetical protein A3B10_00275 [Candidatus Doudnabacteria bacterium RIFCSPLOWO2_01_FULL_44_21]|uniref:DUF3105 domain-containing protein n=1 Tax=Candidatus Doudnabacteria bacterium RIFCSPLOWO2_01_FULL_44_21 TaxID=1817841 RepID=A0A1F5PXF0_9BACT|nr:MAG: hypothetical protein A3B95_03730 [Candidatus Doudnabacteria bacterium RIFCSPHIGHO2_02_FULL_43_13b]OGE94583.1 MAG: hypothetical protein A3B10_00275 [Candidatus Doudnabacteria bacterium RIFCSPLOWO2_01_FULL_44_21]